ncbi:MAG: hypothetical protein DIU78_005850 [Pseudomonadota bacterium]|nr:MAG: hypothetical protein DIU78_11440 [Pseudomonadota bacterium]
MVRYLAVISLSLVAALGCKDREACERARMDLAKTWTKLRESAARRKLAGVDVEGWKFVEEKAALLESSFLTPQVTWQSAEKARQELAGRVNALRTDTEANQKGFQLSVQAAFKAQDEFTAQCR